MQSDSIADSSEVPWFIPIVINLGHRNDRMANAISESSKLNLKLFRIEAVNADDLVITSSFVTKGALACWESHKLAMRHLLNSPYDFALILEDDFKILDFKAVNRLLDSPRNFQGVDIFQFGFLVNDYKERIDLIFRNLENFLFSILGKINVRIFNYKLSFSNRLRVRRKIDLPFNWVSDDFRAGAHAYLISKEAATRILTLNEPTFLTTDAFFVALNSAKAFRISRSYQSLIGQIDSPSSIKNWGIEISGSSKN
jgi:GR25 family glycosyltransferase involved in LPS biosynthesis